MALQAEQNFLLLLRSEYRKIFFKFNTFNSFFSLQFIDLCILLGCDYCDSIKGTDYSLLHQGDNLNTVQCVENINDHLFITMFH